jgi:hypothetical protein
MGSRLRRIFPVVSSGGPAVEVDFTLAGSDSFDRGDGAPGNTDGAGIDGVTGGSGLSWTDKVGTSGITSNRLRFTAVSGGVGITVVDTGKTDGVVVGQAATAGANSIGLTLRYVDTSNYVHVYINTTDNITLREVIAGSPTVLLTSSCTYVADAEMVVRLDGRRVSIEYNGVYYGDATMNAAFDSSTLHGMWTNVAGSTINLNEWHFVNLPTYNTDARASLCKPLVGEYLLTAPVSGDSTRCAEWEVRQEKTNLGGGFFSPSDERIIMKLSLVTISSGAKSVITSDVNGSSWEHAGLIGADADIEGDYGYFGSIHQNVNFQSISEIVLGIGTVARWKRYYSNRVQLTQTMDIIYPKDDTTDIGDVTMHHIVDSQGLMLKRSYTYAAGYKIYSWYGGMMPVTNPNVDRYQVGTEAAAAMVLDDGAKNTGTEGTTYKSWLNGGDFTLVMTLPKGGPDDNGDWSNSTIKGWFSDNATSPQKFYVNYVEGTFANKITAATSSHTVRYRVENGTP